ncbi:MAG TPA: hypothetical protein VGV40_10155 [Solirubrobacteraceae bacterium]|nr:hypothetical protein [Solirubrobacteraceae bacterium]
MPANGALVIALLLVTSVLFALGAWSVVRLSTRALQRLGIDPAAAALWLGLAEFPPEEAPASGPRPRALAHAPRDRAPTRPSRGPAPSPAPRRRRPAVEWGESADFAFAFTAQAPVRHNVARWRQVS